MGPKLTVPENPEKRIVVSFSVLRDGNLEKGIR
jgi:hypothetical protein